MNKRIFKRGWVFLLVIISALTLAACGKNASKVPYGSVSDKNYISGDGFKITEKELYDEMKLSGTSVLNKMLYEILYKEELEKIKASPEDYQKDFQDYVNKAIFGQTDLKKLKELPQDNVTKSIRSYVDAMYLLGITITESDIDSTNFEAHAQVILDYYKLDVAKRIYAKEKLEEDVLDKDKTSYIDQDKDIETYFKNNVEKRYPLSYISIRFSNLFEAESVLRQYSLAPYRGLWYKLPDPRVEVVSGYALSVLTDLGYQDDNGSIDDNQYREYYDIYKKNINPDRPHTDGSKEEKVDMDETLNIIFRMYNEAYPYLKPLDADTYTTIESVLAEPSLVGLGETQGSLTKTYDDFPTNDRNQIAQIRTYLYSTLSTEENGVRFTAQPRAYGNYYYIIFKLKDHDEEVKAQLEDGIFKVKNEDGSLTTYAQEYFEKIKESKLTDAYINQQATQRLNDSKVTIFDEEIHLTLRNDKFKLSKKASKDILVNINNVDIKVDDYYSLLESQFGVSVGMDLSVRKALLASKYKDQITKKELDEYRGNVENMIRQFSNDQFKQSGFPKEMGRAKFLKLAFKANSIDEAVTNIYVTAKVEELYLKDYENHYGVEFYDKLALYANRLQEQYFSLSASHLLISVDMNEDEIKDKPTEFFETLSEIEQEEYRVKVLELMQIIHDKASQSSNIATGLDNIVKEFNDSPKIRPASCDTPEGANAPSCTWYEYKRMGLSLLFESLSATTNQTNYPDQQSKLDDKFYQRMMDIYTYLKAEEYDINKEFPKAYLDTRPSSYAQVLETDFGWHLILATGGAVSKSAKFTLEDDTKLKEDDEFKIYEHIKLTDKDGKDIFVDAYSDSDNISANQVRIYINQKSTTEGVTSLPSVVKTAIQSYLDPVIAKYDNQYTKLALLHKFLTGLNYTYENSDNTRRLEMLLEINSNQFLLYAQDNQMFNDIYGDWFTTFN